MFRNNQSIYCKDEKIAAKVRAYAKQLNAMANVPETPPVPEKPIFTAGNQDITVDMSIGAVNTLSVYEINQNFRMPMLEEWEQFQQYPWVFEQARNALIRDFDGQTVTIDVIKEYVERRLKLID